MTRKWVGIWIAFAGLAATAVGQGSEESELDILRKQVDQLEARLADVEQGGASTATVRDESSEDEINFSLREPSAARRLNISAPWIDGVNIGGRYRARGEHWNDYDAPDGMGGFTDDTGTSFGQSIELDFDVAINERAGLFLQLLDARVWGTSPNSVDNNVAGTQDNDYVSQAFISLNDVMAEGIDFQIGRQIYEVGSGRILGYDPWTLNIIALDGIANSVDLGDGLGTIHLAGFRTADGSAGPFELGRGAMTGDTGELYSLYYVNKDSGLGEINAYALYLDSDTSTPSPSSGGANGAANLFTIGARSAHSVAGLFWDVEGAVQRGRYRGMRTSDAFFSNFGVFARAGFDVDSGDWKLKPYVGFDYATGDTGNDDNWDQFVQINPKLHGWFGITDLVSWSNVEHYVVGTRLEMPLFGAPAGFDVSWRWLRKAHENAPIVGGYNTPGGLGGTGGSAQIGQELDLVYSTQYTEMVNFDFGWGWFFPGEGWRNAVDDNHIHFVYGQVQMRF